MVSAISCFSAGAANLHIENLMSPDGRNVVNVQFDDNAVYYEVFRDDVRISGLCALSMTVDDETWGAGSMPRKITRDCISEEIRFIVPRKYDRITVMYNVLILHYKGYNIEFRAYDDGIAYRFSGTSNRIGEVVSERIEYVLSFYGKTKYRVAKDTSISESTLYNWKFNRSAPTLENIITLADYLECSVEFILGREN